MHEHHAAPVISTSQEPLRVPPRVHLVRHGQGQHQLEPLQEHRQISDPRLTDASIERCKQFNTHFPDAIPVALVCASPMRRAIQTAQHCFEKVIPRTESKRILLLPLAQENTDEPCDIGSRPDVIEAEFGDAVDASLLKADWMAKDGMNAATPTALVARAKEFRKWIFQRPEKEIVVCGHGAFWDYVTGAVDDHGHLLHPGASWTNREWRSYVFAKDVDCHLIEEKESIARRGNHQVEKQEQRSRALHKQEQSAQEGQELGRVPSQDLVVA